MKYLSAVIREVLPGDDVIFGVALFEDGDRDMTLDPMVSTIAKANGGWAKVQGNGSILADANGLRAIRKVAADKGFVIEIASSDDAEEVYETVCDAVYARLGHVPGRSTYSPSQTPSA